MKKLLKFLVITVILISCTPREQPSLPIPVATSYPFENAQLDKAQYYDRILGALVGSAIGDAMGASTEMWHRRDIRNAYGYINTLTPAIREKSPEGTWRHNMSVGSTTDDTRWKYFLSQYFVKNKNDLGSIAFARFIIGYYQGLVKNLSDAENLSSTDLLDQKMDQINWIKEWARVALAFEKTVSSNGSSSQFINEYAQAQNRFYGGEMSCAGLLYTPMFGLISDHPEKSYVMAYDHSIFDIGYARDISALAAAMTTFAMHGNDIKAIISESIQIDPFMYHDSRLIGRLSIEIIKDVQTMIQNSKSVERDTTGVVIPIGFDGNSHTWVLQEYLYQQLEDRQKSIAFHAGEIWQILITALLFGEGDFEKTMSFIVNYGRDNDTVAAAAGLILGALWGYSELPAQWKETVLATNKNILGIDLEEQAQAITDHYWISIK